jgi:hypothetical protein
VGKDHLERDDPTEFDVPGLIDNSHSAAADYLQDFVSRNLRHFLVIGGGGLNTKCGSRKSLQVLKKGTVGFYPSRLIRHKRRDFAQDIREPSEELFAPLAVSQMTIATLTLGF